jgi:hypothetical protein
MVWKLDQWIEEWMMSYEVDCSNASRGYLCPWNAGLLGLDG